MPLVWRDHYGVAVLAAPELSVASALAGKGFELVVLGTKSADWPARIEYLAKLLGRSA
jgi:hypothetical protein